MDDIDLFLKEDLGKEGDITSESLFTNEIGKASIISKEDCIVSGLEEAKEVFGRTGAKINLKVEDGEQIKKNTIVAEVEGPLRSILKGERLALNFIGRMSGISTETKKLVDKCKKINPNIQIAATRKTTPGFRKYEKKAVTLAGGIAHRFGLFDVVMIKDNHIKAVGSIEESIKRVKEKVSNKIIEVEVENEQDAIVATKMGVDVIMLDNFKADEAEATSQRVRKTDSKIIIEISGGITPDNIEKYASFADRISLGYLTHSIKNRNFSLEML